MRGYIVSLTWGYLIIAIGWRAFGDNELDAIILLGGLGSVGTFGPGLAVTGGFPVVSGSGRVILKVGNVPISID